MKINSLSKLIMVLSLLTIGCEIGTSSNSTTKELLKNLTTEVSEVISTYDGKEAEIASSEVTFFSNNKYEKVKIEKLREVFAKLSEVLKIHSEQLNTKPQDTASWSTSLGELKVILVSGKYLIKL